MNKVIELEKIIMALRSFSKARNWDQFHTPKNLTSALSVEASELLEIFQWLNDEESKSIKIDEQKFQKVKEEMADVFYYLFRLADVLDIDLEKAFWDKLQKNEEKYPVEMAYGNANKYTDF